MRNVNVARGKNLYVVVCGENFGHNHLHLAGHTSQQFLSTSFVELVMHSLDKWFNMSVRQCLSYMDNDNENIISMKWSKDKYLACNET